MNIVYDTAFRQAASSGLLPSSTRPVVSLVTYAIDLYSNRISHTEVILWLLYCNAFLSSPFQTMAWTLLVLAVSHTPSMHMYRSSFSEIVTTLNAADKVMQHYATCYLAPHAIAFGALALMMPVAWLPRETLLMAIRALTVVGLGLSPLGQARLLRKYKVVFSTISFLLMRAYLYNIGGAIVDSDASVFIVISDGQVTCVLDAIILPDGKFASAISHSLDASFTDSKSNRMTFQYTLSSLSVSACTRILDL